MRFVTNDFIKRIMIVIIDYEDTGLIFYTIKLKNLQKIKKNEHEIFCAHFCVRL